MNTETKIETKDKIEKKLRKVENKTNNKETYNFLNGILYMKKVIIITNFIRYMKLMMRKKEKAFNLYLIPCKLKSLAEKKVRQIKANYKKNLMTMS